uniref:Phage ABA sandwich domain-containing protein n=1 Tax=viral metagenome TaxID=1070528 RepID=A0A6M3L2S3_9ZZZZ
MTPAEMNRLIAEKVMGLKTSLNLHTETWWVFQGDCELLYELPDPYHDERDCMRALAVMRKKGWYVCWELDSTGHTVYLNRWDNGWQGAEAVCRPTFCAAACEAMRQAMEKGDDE